MLELPPDYLDQIKAVYPKRAGDNGWIAVRTLIPRAISAGSTWNQILTGAKNYAIHCQRKGMLGSEFVKQAKTFFGPNGWFEEWAELDMRTPAEIAAENRRADVIARGQKLGYRPIGATESVDAYETQLRHLEREREPRGEPKFAVVR